jgi:hypothetical protein
MRTFSAFFVVLAVIVCTSRPLPANADMKQFFPKIYSYTGELEVDMTYNSEDNTSGGKGLGFTDIFSRQRLNLHFNGYIYHPKFILYSLRLSSGIKEENYQSMNVGSGWVTGKSVGYDFRTFILPEHPYNLELFATRLEPLSRQALSRLSSVAYTKGAIFRYKKKPYFATLSYIDATDESSDGAYDSTSYNANISYYREYVNGKLLQLGAEYNRRESSTSFSSFRGSAQNATLVGDFVVHFFSISSALAYNSFTQGGTSNDTTNDTLSLRQSVNASLPWNLTTNLTYGLSKSKETSSVEGASGFNSTGTENNLQWNITHRLYQSLVTNYGFGYDSQNTSTGDSKSMSHSVGVTYTKNIRWGRLLAGANYTLSDVTNQGALQIINEVHDNIAVSGVRGVTSFFLNRQNVEVSTIKISVTDPISHEDVLLTKDIDYDVRVIGTTVSIDVFSLPASTDFPIPGTYSFVASYALVARNDEFRTSNISYNVRTDLFNNLLSLYYNHFTSKQTEVSGTFPGPALDQSQDTFGVIVSKAPYTFLVEYTNAASNITPYKQLRTELRYLKDLTMTMRVQATAGYTSTNYSLGTNGSGQPYTDNVASIAAGMQQRFIKQNITLSVDGSFAQRTGLSNSSIYGGNASFTWRTKRLFVTLGGMISSSTSEYQGINSKRLSQYYYLNMKRQLF